MLREDLLTLLAAPARWLPHQGPLAVFVHHNTLSEWEELDFHATLAAAQEALGARVRLPEADYREMLADGRIERADLRAVFDQEAIPDGPAAKGLPPLRDLAWSWLLHGQSDVHWRVRAFHVAEGDHDPMVGSLDRRVQARLAERARRGFSDEPAHQLFLLTGCTDPGDRDRRLRVQLGVAGPEELLQRVREGMGRAAEVGYALLVGSVHQGLPPRKRKRRQVQHRDRIDRAVDELLLPVLAGLLDLGQGTRLPPAEADLFTLGMAALRRSLPELKPAADAPAAATALLARLDWSEGQVAEALSRCVLVRPGWAGALVEQDHHQLGRLADYAVLRLLGTVHLAWREDFDPQACLGPQPPALLGPMARADRLAQMLVRHCPELGAQPRLAPGDLEALELLTETYDEHWRSRVLQEARERTARRRWLTALAARARLGSRTPAAPRVQVLACIDDREESYRRALEELGGDTIETFGVAGHFGLGLRWRGAGDLHDSCRHPPAAASTHRLVEQRAEPPASRGRWAGRLGRWVDRVGLGVVGGALASLQGLGYLLWAPLRVLAPDLATRTVEAWLQPSPGPGPVALFRDQEPPPGELPAGFTHAEAAEQVSGLLQAIGLTTDLSPTVLVLGHGSSSLNNPHEAAHDCGACGGQPGGASARVFAALANDSTVRALLAARGLVLPPGVRFVGGMHDTATDRVHLFDPVEPALSELLSAASARDALERSRRFASLSLEASESRAQAHVEARAVDPSQVRPEYGHATNALLVVGPRELTRGLFLDRRAFLQSYRPEADPDGSGLQGLLAAVVPVCAGINLEYYFSRVDNEVFGAGTKIPHNLTGLRAVMNGSLSDLRTGLPWQMVEIHEPTRLLVVVMADRDRIRAALDGLPQVRRLVAGGWVHCAVVDQGEAWTWTPQGFLPEALDELELPVVADSVRWFRGRRQPLAPALVGGA